MLTISLSGCTEFDNLIQGDNPAESTYTVIFRVSSLETGSLISACRIGWNTIDGTVSIFHTNNEGKTTITNVGPGEYAFYINAPVGTSYNAINQQITITSNVLIKVYLATGESSSSYEIIKT